ncbi:MAG TPA: class I SAM-dependent methyltransferase [Pyrinomonadaceae bacterium]|nr:class I SAM-dependent methyltransferase [Pyrinomonadaceae bacterium]
MTKTTRELAFLRDLSINENWTSRFTDLLDKHTSFKDAANILYINAGTGDHCIALRERSDEEIAIFATCENEDLLNIARDKAAAVGADVDFSMIEFEEDSFDAVIVDATFVPPSELEDLIGESVSVAKSGGSVAVVLPSAGSFGEVFSLLWEVLFSEGLGEHGAAVETILADIPGISRIEEMAKKAGLAKVKTETSIEVFEYENGKEFVAASLIADFLLPEWLEMLDENEKEQVTEKLAQLIDSEDADLKFRFSVKATVLTAQKA